MKVDGIYVLSCVRSAHGFSIVGVSFLYRSVVGMMVLILVVCRSDLNGILLSITLILIQVLKSDS